MAGSSPTGCTHLAVMPGLVPGIHVFLSDVEQDVDGRDKPGHDVERAARPYAGHDVDRAVMPGFAAHDGDVCIQ